MTEHEPHHRQTTAPEAPEYTVEQLRDLLASCRREVHLSRAAADAAAGRLEAGRRLRVTLAVYAQLRVASHAAQVTYNLWNAEMSWALDLAAENGVYA